MKRMKRITVLLAMTLLSFLVMVAPVLAATETKDGVVVTLTTDKETYLKDESVEATLTVKNTHSAALENVSLSNIVPEGFKLAEGQTNEKKVKSLKPNETVDLKVNYLANSNGDSHVVVNSSHSQDQGNKTSPNTGISGDLTGWILCLATVIAGIILLGVLKKKSQKKLLSLFLCVILTGSMLSLFPHQVKAEEKKTEKIKIETTVKVDQQSLKLQGVVLYDLPNQGSSGDNSIQLSADQTEFEVMSDGNVIFYAKVNHAVEKIELMDVDTDQPILELKDDGKYVDSGDDLPGDNIYSGKMSLDTSKEKEFSFVAKVTIPDQLVSNTVKCNVYASFSEEQLQDMDKVDSLFQEELFEASGYDDMTVSERKEKADALIEQLISEDLIQKDTVLYDEETQSYTFVYRSGVLGSLVIKNWYSETNGSEEIEIQKEQEKDLPEDDEALKEESEQEPEELPLEDTKEEVESETDSIQDNVEGQSHEVPGSNSVAEKEETLEDRVLARKNSAELLAANAQMNKANPEEKVSLGKAMVLWSFDQKWDDSSFRRPFYESLEKEWDHDGLETTVNFNTTIEDYKKLTGYDVIVFSGHGAYQKYTTGIFGLNKTTVSSLLLHEKSTWSKNSKYSADLKAFRIGKCSVQGGTMYAILPEFFSHYYGNSGLDGSFVFAENCEFYGKKDNVVSKMADEIRGASSESVIGFHNSVMAEYSREFMKDYVDGLIEGKTTEDAFETSVKNNGKDDYFTGREKYGPTAYPLYRWNGSASLINNRIENGDFEQADSPVKWNRVGDTRVIDRLGSLMPISQKRMGILTTGIGSAEEDYLAGTEGSVLWQKVKITDQNKTLNFHYDFVSEEPLEYVGSNYNDAFIVQIVSQNGVETIWRDDVNSAVWQEIDGINFDGGDHTTYHTLWKNVNYDLSKYNGQVVDIRFMVYDVGDSIYDSAVLLDAVTLN